MEEKARTYRLTVRVLECEGWESGAGLEGGMTNSKKRARPKASPSEYLDKKGISPYH
jgi:hypothetical protein